MRPAEGGIRLWRGDLRRARASFADRKFLFLRKPTRFLKPHIFFILTLQTAFNDDSPLLRLTFL